MTQNILVFLIVGLAVGYVIRKLYRSIIGKSGCGCAGPGCGTSAGCTGCERQSASPADVSPDTSPAVEFVRRG